jgi:hypothetical protein
LAAGLALGGFPPPRAAAQVPAPAPTIDSIVVITRDVFEPEEADLNPVFGAMNAIHVKTRAGVVRRELLFKAGEPLDSARLQETERNLRRVGLFRSVVIQPREQNGRLVVYVVTFDAWSTTLGLNARSTGGVFTWSINSSEGNLAGTGNAVGVGYRKDADRTAFNVSAVMPRVASTRLRASGVYDWLSDGHSATLNFGQPYRSLSDAHSFDLQLASARRRVLAFRDGQFSSSFQQRLFRTTAVAGVAPQATPRGYFRINLSGVLKNEEYVRSVDTLQFIPDTVTGAVGVGADWRRANFMVVTHFNGFARDEDVDLSRRIQFGTWLAPAAFGYARTGAGPYVDAQAGWRIGRNFIRLTGRANGLFTSAGLDSGRTTASVLGVARVIPRQATIFYVAGGLQHRIPPGYDFDLGHGSGPRSFKPHAFTGNRVLWGTIEHRIYLIDELAGFLGVGLAAFFDYGGAWFADDRVRKGGNIGIGLRLGATRASSTSVGRFDLGYRVGDGVTTGRWVFSFGRSVPY